MEDRKDDTKKSRATDPSRERERLKVYGQGRIWLPSIVTIAVAIWFVLANYPSRERERLKVYGQGWIWLPSIVTIAVAIWFVLANSNKKKKNKETPSSPAPIVNNPTTSTSASTADLVGEYEVFLSFRGADTRNGLTDYLYNDLVDAGIRTFRDDNELRIGEEIGPELLRAIKQSKISIPIFSKNYASSKWCLREFTQMVDCRANGEQMIYPIFYDVEPNEVQHCERGSYKDAFLKHKKDTKLDAKTVQQWKAALEIVGDLKGWELKKVTNGREGELVKVIVEEVLLELKKNYTHVPENLVGMGSHIEKLNRLLKVDSGGVRIVGIHGMGGLGKTTIAKVIYNQLCEQLERCCFLDDVRDNSKEDKDIVKLQNQLLSKIQNREVPEFSEFHKGRAMIKDAVHRKKVLLVIDNVDKIFQIDMLVGDHNWFGDGSRIIITTRNKDVLDTIEKTCREEGRLEVYESYKPELLNDDDSLKLFCRHAFRRDSPPEDYNILAKNFVSTAANLPLVLVTLGSSLFVEEDKDVWEEKLRKLEEVPDDEVVEKLRFSFEALNHFQKQIFLDIALVFHGDNKREPFYMWDDLNFYPKLEIKVLVRRSLITIGDDDTLLMHDSLRDLGKQIIREEGLSELGKRSRLQGEEALQVLNAHQGTKYVQIIRLYAIQEFKIFGGSMLSPCLEEQDFGKLPNLRYLSMVYVDLDGDFKNLFQNLRWLRWWFCAGTCSPTNFYLMNLVGLDLTKSTVTDDWGGWSQIKRSIKLKVLILSGCFWISRVPHLSAFSTLERLELQSCMSLCRLDGLEQLESLKYLNASHCSDLERLPDLSKLKKLHTLILRLCGKLTALQGLDNLESLEVLDTNSCNSLEGLPNLSNLKKLTRLESSSCENLVEIQGLDRLASLEHLDISFCNSLKKLPDLSNLKRLRKLVGVGLNLTEVQGLGGLESLEHLNMSDWEHTERLLDLSKLKWLRELKISKLITIQGLERMESLGHLDMGSCESIEILPDLPNFGMLKHVSLRDCKKLQNVETLRVVAESLESLDVSSCEVLDKMPDLSMFKNLKKLSISFLEELTEIQGLGELKSLESLDVSRCKSIVNLPDFSNFTNLKNLNVGHCVKLTEIRGLEELKFLEWLRVVGCKSLENLPYLPNTVIEKDREDESSDYQFSD